MTIRMVKFVALETQAIDGVNHGPQRRAKKALRQVFSLH